MKSGLFFLILALGSPLPFVTAAPTLEEDAVVEISRSVRRSSAVERQKVRILPGPVPAAPVPVDAPVLLPSSPQVDLTLVGPRPPPAV